MLVKCGRSYAFDMRKKINSGPLPAAKYIHVLSYITKYLGYSINHL